MRKLVVIFGALALVVLVGVCLAPITDHARIENTDFVNFYTGASIVRSGEGERLYRLEVQRATLRAVLGRESTQYFLHPPFEAAMLAPLARLTIEHAFVLWTLVNVAMLALLPLLLTPCIPLVARRPYVALLGFCFLPALTALTLGQDSIVLLFVISLSYLLMQKKLDTAAGLALALVAIKFQYLVILIPLIVAWRKLRVLAGIVLGCAGLVVVSVMVTGWRGLLNYPSFVLAFNEQAGSGGPVPLLMVNIRGFLAGIGWMSHSLAPVVAGGAMLCALAVLCTRAAPVAQKSGLTFALYIAVTLTAAPVAHFPDMTILLLPALLAMNSLAETGRENFRASLMALSCGLLFVWPVLLLVLGGQFWWNSRIYLVFPVIMLFVFVLSAELYLVGESSNGRLKSLPLSLFG